MHSLKRHCKGVKQTNAHSSRLANQPTDGALPASTQAPRALLTVACSTRRRRRRNWGTSAERAPRCRHGKVRIKYSTKVQHSAVEIEQKNWLVPRINDQRMGALNDEYCAGTPVWCVSQHACIDQNMCLLHGPVVQAKRLVDAKSSAQKLRFPLSKIESVVNTA